MKYPRINEQKWPRQQKQCYSLAEQEEESFSPFYIVIPGHSQTAARKTFHPLLSVMCYVDWRLGIIEKLPFELKPRGWKRGEGERMNDRVWMREKERERKEGGGGGNLKLK